MKPIDSEILTSIEDLKAVVEASRGAGLTIALDIETTDLKVYESKVTWLSWCDGKKYGAIPLRHRNQNRANGAKGSNQNEDELRNIVRAIHRDKANTIIWHNSKFDLSILVTAKWLTLDDVQATIFDTLLASYVLDPVRDREGFGHGLKELHDIYFAEDGKQPDFESVCNGRSLEDVLFDKAAYYAAYDSVTTYKLFEKFQRELDSDKQLKRYFENIEIPHLLTTIEMITNGLSLMSQEEVRVSKMQTITDLRGKLAQVKSNIFRMMGTVFNFDSPDELRKALFHSGLGIRPYGKNLKSRKHKIDKATLAKIFRSEPSDTNKEIIANIMYAKQLTEIIKKHKEVYSNTNRVTRKIHANFRSTTATGRYAASRPNVLSLPSVSGIKEQIVAGPGNAFVIADFSQIDLRVIANEAAEIDSASQMFQDINKGIDLHLSTLRIVRTGIDPSWKSLWTQGQQLLGVTLLDGSDKPFEGELLERLKDVEKDRKEIAKEVNFGISYGLGADGLLESLNNPKDFSNNIIKLRSKNMDKKKWLQEIEESLPRVHTIDEVHTYLQRFHRAYPGIKKFQKVVEEDLCKDGYTYNLFGKKCKAQVASHFSRASFDVRIHEDEWYRLKVRTLKVDDVHIYAVLLQANILKVKDRKSTTTDRSELKNLERKEGYLIYKIDENILNQAIEDYKSDGDSLKLRRTLMSLNEKSNLAADRLFETIQASVPLMKFAKKDLESPEWWTQYPFIKLQHRSIKFVRVEEDGIDLPYYSYEDLRRELISARIQSASMDICKIAMAKFRDRARKRWPNIAERPRIVNCIHDEIAVECRQSDQDKVQKLLLRCMRGLNDGSHFRKYLAPARKLLVKIDAKCGSGNTYQSAKP